MLPAIFRFSFLILLGLFSANASFAQSDFRAFVYDSKHGAYEECDPNEQYSVVTKDSLLKRGYIIPLSDKRFLLAGNLKTDTVLLSDVIYFGYANAGQANYSVGKKVGGYLLVAFGSIITLTAFAALLDGEQEVSAVIAIVGVPLLASGIVLLNSGYNTSSRYKSGLASKRYQLRLVRSAL
ncbi:MAG: hypothetical protein V4658_00425 [Bacteroidota bacterium]